MKEIVLSPGVIGYKAMAHEQWNEAAFKSGCNDQRDDWAALYLGVGADMSEGYLVAPESGNGKVHLFEVALKSDMRAYVSQDGSFGEADAAQLAATTKAELGIADGSKLMPALAARDHLFMCRSDPDGGMEIIVPKELVSQLEMRHVRTVEFKNFMQKGDVLDGAPAEGLFQAPSVARYNGQQIPLELGPDQAALAGGNFARLMADFERHDQSLAAEVPGVVGADATHQALERLSENDRVMFGAIRDATPAHVGDPVVAAALVAAKQAGIQQPEQIQHVALNGDTLWVQGTTPGYRASVDVTAAQPTVQASLQETERLSGQRQQQLADAAPSIQHEGGSRGVN